MRLIGFVRERVKVIASRGTWTRNTVALGSARIVVRSACAQVPSLP